MYNLFIQISLRRRHLSVGCVYHSVMLLFRYDVLILHADEDSKFADKMAQVLEQQRIKVCLKDRDLLGGWSL